MNTISIKYNLVWYLLPFPEYQFDQNKNCINTRTGRKIKRIKCGGSIGFTIRGKFMSQHKLRPMLRKIKPIDCPF